MDQQFSAAEGVVGGRVALFSVLVDMGPDQPKSPLEWPNVGPFEPHVAVAEALDLVARQRQARLAGFEDVIFVARLPVLDHALRIGKKPRFVEVGDPGKTWYLRPMPSPRPLSNDLSFASIFKVVAVALGLVTVWLIQDIVLYCFLAILLAGVIYPVANWGVRHRIPKTVSVLCLYLLLFGVLALIVTLLVPALIGQTRALVTTYGDRLGDAARIVRDLDVLTQIQSAGFDLSSGLSGLQGQAQTFLSNALSTVVDIFGGIAGFVVVLVLALYVVIEDSAIKRVFHEWVPKGYQDFATRLTWLLMEKLGAWMRGQLLLCLIIGLMYLVAFGLIGVPYALLLAVIGGLFEFIPYIGPILSAVPAVMLAFTKSPTTALVTLAALILIQQLENNLIVPKITEKTLGLNPIVSIIAFLIGAKLFGTVGAIVSIPVAMAVAVTLSEWREFRRTSPERHA